MKKIFLLTSLGLTNQTSFAATSILQNLDNQISFGYSYLIQHAYNPQYSGSSVDTNSSNLNVHLEHLYASNLWFNADGSFAVKVNQTAPGGVSFSQNTQTFGFPAAISGKVGYSFNWQAATDGFQIIPYLSIGRELNYNGMSAAQTGLNTAYLNLFGGGARIEYAFASIASIYADQLVGFLQDPQASSFNQSANTYTTKLGIRYNVTRYFQLNAEGTYNYTSLINQSLGYDPISLSYSNTMQNSYGATLGFAYLFDNDQRQSASNHNNPLANLDNSYSFGFGIMNTTNSYSGGSAPAITSAINYYDFNLGHLFTNQVWANLDAQLVNSINQTNTPTTTANIIAPTYLGFPGNLQAKAGYGFDFGSNSFQLIPYANGGLIMNINSYTIKNNNSSLTSTLANSRYLQYGMGGRAEYAVNDLFGLYADCLIANLNDQSSLAINAWRSNTTLGVKLNPGSILQLGIKGFYDSINPYANQQNGSTYYALTQNSLGAQFDLGLRY